MGFITLLSFVGSVQANIQIKPADLQMSNQFGIQGGNIKLKCELNGVESGFYNISFSYLNDSNWVFISENQASQLPNGTYVAISLGFTIDTIGNYTIKAKYDGNQKYMGNKTFSTLFVVDPSVKIQSHPIINDKSTPSVQDDNKAVGYFDVSTNKGLLHYGWGNSIMFWPHNETYQNTLASAVMSLQLINPDGNIIRDLPFSVSYTEQMFYNEKDFNSVTDKWYTSGPFSCGNKTETDFGTGALLFYFNYGNITTVNAFEEKDYYSQTYGTHINFTTTYIAGHDISNINDTIRVNLIVYDNPNPSDTVANATTSGSITIKDDDSHIPVPDISYSYYPILLTSNTPDETITISDHDPKGGTISYNVYLLNSSGENRTTISSGSFNFESTSSSCIVTISSTELKKYGEGTINIYYSAHNKDNDWAGDEESVTNTISKVIHSQVSMNVKPEKYQESGNNWVWSVFNPQGGLLVGQELNLNITLFNPTNSAISFNVNPILQYKYNGISNTWNFGEKTVNVPSAKSIIVDPSNFNRWVWPSIDPTEVSNIQLNVNASNTHFQLLNNISINIIMLKAISVSFFGFQADGVNYSVGSSPEDFVAPFRNSSNEIPMVRLLYAFTNPNNLPVFVNIEGGSASITSGITKGGNINQQIKISANANQEIISSSWYYTLSTDVKVIKNTPLFSALSIGVKVISDLLVFQETLQHEIGCISGAASIIAGIGDISTYYGISIDCGEFVHSPNININSVKLFENSTTSVKFDALEPSTSLISSSNIVFIPSDTQLSYLQRLLNDISTAATLYIASGVATLAGTALSETGIGGIIGWGLGLGLQITANILDLSATKYENYANSLDPWENYTSIYVPPPISHFNSSGSAFIDQLLNTSQEEMSYADAVAHTENRYNAAVAADNMTAASIQNKILAKYLVKYSLLLQTAQDLSAETPLFLYQFAQSNNISITSINTTELEGQIKNSLTKENLQTNGSVLNSLRNITNPTISSFEQTQTLLNQENMTPAIVFSNKAMANVGNTSKIFDTSALDQLKANATIFFQNADYENCISTCEQLRTVAIREILNGNNASEYISWAESTIQTCKQYMVTVVSAPIIALHSEDTIFQLNIQGTDNFTIFLTTPWDNLSTTVFINGTGTVQFTVPIPLVPPGTYQMNITLYGLGTGIILRTSQNIEIFPFYSYLSSLVPVLDANSPGGTISFVIHVNNLGNLNDTYIIKVTQQSLPSSFPAQPLQIPSTWGGLSAKTLSLKFGTSGEVSLNFSIPENWTGFINTVYPFIVTIQSTGDPELNSTLEGNSTVHTTLLSSMLWVKTEMGVLDQIMDNLTMCVGTRHNDMYRFKNNEEWTSTNRYQSIDFRSLECWVDRAQENINLATAILNNTSSFSCKSDFEMLQARFLEPNNFNDVSRVFTTISTNCHMCNGTFNTTRYAAFLTLTAKSDIEHFLSGLVKLNRTCSARFGKVLIQPIAETLNMKVLLAQMLDKLVPNPLLKVNIALTFLQANISSTLSFKVANNPINHLVIAQDSIDRYQISLPPIISALVTLKQLDAFSHIIRMDMVKGVIEKTQGLAILAQVNPLINYVITLLPGFSIQSNNNRGCGSWYYLQYYFYF